VGQKEEEESECDGVTMWLAKGRPNKNGKGGDRIGLGMLLHKDGRCAGVARWEMQKEDGLSESKSDGL
jgi:hypothetical protein